MAAIDTDGPFVQAGRTMTKTLVIALAVVLAIGGCSVWETYVALVKAPYRGVPYSVTYGPDHRRSVTYHYNAPRDPLGSVHEFRPDIYYRMFPR